MLFTQFTVDQSKLTVNGSVLSDTPDVRYLAALYNIQNSINESYIKIVHMFVLKCVFYVLQHSLCKKEQNRPLWHAYVFVSWVVCLYCDAIV